MTKKLPADNPVAALAELQRRIDRYLGDDPTISDQLAVVAILRTIADRIEQRVMAGSDDAPKTPPAA